MSGDCTLQLRVLELPGLISSVRRASDRQGGVLTSDWQGGVLASDPGKEGFLHLTGKEGFLRFYPWIGYIIF